MTAMNMLDDVFLRAGASDDECVSVWVLQEESGFCTKAVTRQTVLTNASVYTDGQLGPQNNTVLLPSGPETVGGKKFINHKN